MVFFFQNKIHFPTGRRASQPSFRPPKRSGGCCPVGCQTPVFPENPNVSGKVFGFSNSGFGRNPGAYLGRMHLQLEFEQVTQPSVSPVQTMDSSWRAEPMFFRGARPLSAGEWDGLFRCAKRKPRNAALLGLLYFAAMRISEATAIRWEDLAFSSDNNKPGALRLRRQATKGKRIGMNLPLHPQAQDALKKWLSSLQAKQKVSPRDFVFSGRAPGSRLSRISAWEMVKRAYAQAGMTGRGYALHSLRKAAANAILANTKNVEIVRQTLRHARLDTTQAYLTEDAGAVAEAILRL